MALMTAAAELEQRVSEIAAEWTMARAERLQRRALERADFDRLVDTGFLLTGVPVEEGGLWEDVARSTRRVCEVLRVLGRGDPSVALVCAMHPTVLGFWLTTPVAPEPYQSDWASQRRRIFETVRGGAWWGTITSEPGSGGDILRTRAEARSASDGTYRLTGDKQFGSGSGVTSYMMTTALPDGEPEPDLFYLDVRGAAWDGSTGMRLTAAWDGQGMAATQSHAFRFEGFPAIRSAWRGGFRALGAATQPYIRCCFTAVFIGIADAAIAAARAQLQKRGASSLRAYEEVEWTRAELEAWLAEQAYEGMLRAIENGRDAARATVQGKLAAAELVESALTRLCRIIGGGTFSGASTFGAWAQDVRALGFLRPPWGLAHDMLLESLRSA
jgi:alkylation response protein AidB-like acyl-CoA dehydrogenase